MICSQNNNHCIIRKPSFLTITLIFQHMYIKYVSYITLEWWKIPNLPQDTLLEMSHHCTQVDV